jgi:hypothetical protein
VDRGVAFVGLPPDDERRIKAAIGIMSVSRQLPVPWRVCAVEEADLIIVTPGTPALDTLLAKASEGRDPAIAALVGASDTLPPSCEKLPWPVRTNDVRNLLLSVEERITRRKNSGAEPPIAWPHPFDTLFELARLLREANEPDSQGSAWIVGGVGPKPLYVVPRERAFMYQGSLSTLRNLLTNGSFEITRISAEDLPESATGKPLVMLQWLVGILLGQKGLLPWIDGECAYSLKRWPDFTVLHHKLEHRRIAAVLVNHACTIPDVLRITQVGSQSVDEFLNAASLTGRLIAANTLQPGASRRPPPNAGNSLFQRLRKALGIGADE